MPDHAQLGQFDGPEIVAPAGTDAASQRLRRIRERFFYVYHHPMWAKYREESAEDLAFVNNTGQWDKGVKAALHADGRSALTINQIRPVLQVITGYERSARQEMKPLPEGPEDLDSVTTLGRIMKKVCEQKEVDYELSDGFGEGSAAGLAAWYVGLDYDADPIYGEPDVVKLEPGEFYYDPDSTRYDLSDAKDCYYLKLVHVDSLTASYPEHADAIGRALKVYSGEAGNPTSGAMPGATIPAYDPRDAYKGDYVANPMLYDKEKKLVLVIEAWAREHETFFLLVDERRNTVDEIPDTPVALQAARAMAAVDPLVHVVKRQRRKAAMTVFLPAVGVELEHGNPYPNTPDDFPFAAFRAYREGGEIFGMVRCLKDPQREYNKRRSAMIDNVSRHGAVKWLAKRTAVENPEWFESGGSAGGWTGWVRNQNEMPTAVTAPPMPEWVVQQEAMAKQEIKEISGVNSDLLGMQDASSSGIAIARRQAAGQIITTSLFDNFKRTKRRIGYLLAKRIQQSYTAERTIRLVSEAGAYEFVTVNQRQQQVTPDGRAVVLNNVPDLAFDVTIADSPSTPTARASTLNLLMELVQKVPQFAAALADEIVALTDVPNREKVLMRIRALMAQQGLLDPISLAEFQMQMAAQGGALLAPPMAGPGEDPTVQGPGPSPAAGGSMGGGPWAGDPGAGMAGMAAPAPPAGLVQ
jgi:hypothetical protein